MKVLKSKVKNQKSEINNGFSLVEMIVYLALLTVLMLVVINALLIMVTSYRNIKAAEVIESSAVTAMDRMTTEIRNAQSIDATGSTFGTNLGFITLNTSTTTPAKVKFYVASSSLAVDEDRVYSGPLISSGARIKTLIFRQISTSTIAAVRIELEIESGTSSSYRSKKFYDTAIVKETY